MKKHAAPLAALVTFSLLAGIVMYTPVEAAVKTPTTAKQAVSVRARDFVVDIPYDPSAKVPRLEDDYYMHVNANWFKTTKINPEEGMASAAQQLEDKVLQQTTDLTTKAIEHQKAGTATQDEKNIANLYSCIVDTQGRDKAQLGNLAPVLAKISAIKDLQSYANTMAALSKDMTTFEPMLGGFAVINNPKDNDRYMVELAAPNTGLNREFFANEHNAPYFEAYRKYISGILTLAGRTPQQAAKTAEELYALQKDLAAHSLTIAEAANPNLGIHILNLQEVKKLYSNINAVQMLDTAGIGPKNGIQQWVMGDTGIAARFNKLFTADKLPLLKEYAVFNVLSAHADVLTPAYYKEALAYRMIRTGAEKEKSATRQTEELNEALLDETYGRLYAKTYFDDESKEQVKSYVDIIRNEYEKLLTGLTWMSPATKQKAILKLKTMDLNIGYPEEWPGYLDKYEIVRPEEGGCLINNTLNMEKAQREWNSQLIGKPVSKTLWIGETQPQTINAFYDQTQNSINFPAGILQAPFYDKNADRETNLGGVGMVIAHEITHSFDNNGAKYDEMGRLRNWWTAKDLSEFKARRGNVAAFYSRYVLKDGTRMKGEQTLSENIADLGGVNCLTRLIGNDTEGLRRMFANFAVIWKNNDTDPILQIRLADIHALPYVRVDAVVSSTDAFYKAYDIKPGDGMYVEPKFRARLW